MYWLHFHFRMCRMDRSSACRVAIWIPAYVELLCQEYHVTSNIRMIIDKDTTIGLISWSS
jgi:hypothetical protein